MKTHWRGFRTNFPKSVKKFYISFNFQVTKDETTITLNDLMPNSSYQFYVAASNSLGEGAKTEILAFRTIKGEKNFRLYITTAVLAVLG